jgi:hypothetical protein
MGTTSTSAHSVSEKQVYVAFPSILGWSMLSSQILFIKVLRFQALVINSSSTTCCKSLQLA